MDVWDGLVERSRQRASMPTSTAPRGLRPLRPTDLEGKPAAAPTERREIALVAEVLRATFRDLVSGRKAWPLYLWGAAGTGKTSAALALLDFYGPKPDGTLSPEIRDWLRGFIEVRFIPRVRIGADKSGYTWSRNGLSGDVRWPDLERSLNVAQLVVFDEIGVGREANDFRLDTLIEVLNARAGDPVKPFIVTSNLPPSEVARVVYDDRVASRILSGTVFRLEGPDRRMPSRGTS